MASEDGDPWDDEQCKYKGSHAMLLRGLREDRHGTHASGIGVGLVRIRATGGPATTIARGRAIGSQPVSSVASESAVMSGATRSKRRARSHR